MQIELTAHGQRIVENLLAQGGFRSADEAVDFALEFFQDCQPTLESLKAKVQAARDDVKAGRVTRFESDAELGSFSEDVKRQGRKRQALTPKPPKPEA